MRPGRGLGRRVHAARQLRVAGRRVPPGAAGRGALAARQRLAEHHRVGAAAQRLGDVGRGADVAVGDQVDVPAAGLVEVVAPGRGGVGDRGRHRHPDAEHPVGGRVAVGADADDHAGRAGAHEVQRRLVVGAAADDHRQVEVGDELLEVQRLVDGRHVLGRDDGALDDQDVDAGVQDHRRERERVLRRDPHRDGAAAARASP